MKRTSALEELYISYYPWFASFFDTGLMCIKEDTSLGADIAGFVHLEKGKYRDQFVIHVNPSFNTTKGKSCEPAHLLHLIQHEHWHVIWDHFSRLPVEIACLKTASPEICKDCPPKKRMKCSRLSSIWGISTDCAINSLIAKPTLDKELNGVNPRVYNLPRYLSSEKYFNLLKKRGKRQQKPEPGEKSTSPYENIEKIIREMANAGQGKDGNGNIQDADYKEMVMQSLMKNAIRQSGVELLNSIKRSGRRESTGHGKWPEEEIRMAGALSKVSGTDIDWDRLIKMDMANGAKLDQVYKKYKVDKRYGTTPGSQIRSRSRVMIGVDTSGSIDQEQTGKFVTQMNRMHLPDAWVAECDASVHAVYKLNQGIVPGHHFKGGGGTQFIPVFKLAKELGCTTLVYYTDGDGTYPPTAMGLHVIWAVSKGRKKVPWGTEIFII